MPDDYNVWSYDFSFTGRNGKHQDWTTLMRPNKKPGDKITLWEATDGNVFVRGSFVTGHKWHESWWRYTPWPRTQGTYFAFPAFLVGMLLAALFLHWLSTVGWFHKAMIWLGLVDDEEVDESEEAQEQVVTSSAHAD